MFVEIQIQLCILSHSQSRRFTVEKSVTLCRHLILRLIINEIIKKTKLKKARLIVKKKKTHDHSVPNLSNIIQFKDRYTHFLVYYYYVGMWVALKVFFLTEKLAKTNSSLQQSTKFTSAKIFEFIVSSVLRLFVLIKIRLWVRRVSSN